MSRQSFSYFRYLSSHFKPKRPQLFSSSSSITSSVSGNSVQTPITESIYFDIEEYDGSSIEQQDFCIIDTVETMSTKQILNLINKQPVADWYQTDLVDEFTTLLNETKSVCHRLDRCRKTIQFAHTKDAISLDLMHIVHFIRERYAHHSSFVTLMGLLMIVIQVLKTEDEVQRQLLDEAHIGRIIILWMVQILSVKVTGFHDLQVPLFQVVLDCHPTDTDHPVWLPALKSVCLQLARRDPTWEQREEYTKVYSIVTHLLLK
ncbi:hypothetical protein A0J61_04382 [Choanephora cucurbitarum]|uniref:Uncharacterized protein n=1 Tax=Choanephora cucurbitarum TaxID=101091 RepID=A0A1C7NES8_9FUNG|nr:hypothetical protein A0J61_04382 [Choanephora cucurbitarum]